MYKKGIGKQKDNISFKRFIMYMNKLNEIKRICKQNYYAEELTLLQKLFKENLEDIKIIDWENL